MINPNHFLHVAIEALRRVRGWLNAQNAARAVTRTTEFDREIFYLPSERYADVAYHVFVDEDGEWVCTCEDYKKRRQPCKHIVEVLDRFFPGTLAPPSPEVLHEALLTAAKQPNWYQNARRFPHEPHQYEEGLAESSRDDDTIENADERIEELLLDLAGELNRIFPLDVGGRPKLPIGDRVFIRLLRFYHRKSIRRFKPALKRLAEEGKIAFPPCRQTIITYDSDPQMIVYMQEAFRIITDVFMLMETDIIVDSSGISPFRISCWRLSKYGTQNFQSGTQWFRMHTAVGQISKAILGFIPTESHGEDTGDSTNLEPLVQGLSARLNVLRFVIADNTYLTEECRLMCKEHSAFLIGPTKPKNFKKDGTPTDAIKDIVAFRSANPKLADELVRARNAIEGVFSTEKRDDNHIAAIGSEEEREASKAGASTLFVSRQVELWARILCYDLNITMKQENRRNRRVSYKRGTLLSHVPEYSPTE